VSVQTPFEQFALDHNRHNHCMGCGGCFLDPSHLVQHYPAWCCGCRDRIKANIRPGMPLPWRGGYEWPSPPPSAPKEEE
jgi:hypothetical protein